jgi:hypothetical protein
MPDSRFHFLAFVGDHPPLEELIGGEQVRPFEFFEFVARRGWKADIWCLRPAARRTISFGEVRVRTIPAPRGIREIGALPFAAAVILIARVQAHFTRNKVIVYHRPGGVSWKFGFIPMLGDVGSFLIWLCNLIGVDSIASVHDVSPEHEEQSVQRRLLASDPSDPAVAARQIRMTGRANAHLQRWCLPRSTIVFATSSKHRDLLLERIPRLDRSQIHIVHPGVRPSIVPDLSRCDGRSAEWSLGVPGSLWDSDFVLFESFLGYLPQDQRFIVRFGGRGADMVSRRIKLPQNVALEPLPTLRYAQFGQFAALVDVFVLVWSGYSATTSPLRVPMCIQTGVPVVTTPLPDLREAGFQDLLDIVSPEPELIAAAVVRAIESRRAGSSALPVVPTWDDRFETASLALRERMQVRSKPQ